MWLTAPNRIGVAGWQVGDSIWMLRALGGTDGVCLQLGTNRLAIQSSNEQPLPLLAEQYVRGDELHWSFPQGEDDSLFGFRIVVRPIERPSSSSSGSCHLFELVISIQTRLLDTHPTLDLVVDGEVRDGQVFDFEGCVAAAYRHTVESGQMAILLGPNDAPFTSHVETAAGPRLRLFGEFLEKGVIRRARPWVVFDQDSGRLDEGTLKSLWDELARSPIPLT